MRLFTPSCTKKTIFTDIDECSENPSICDEKKCENSYGTYTCIEPPTTTTTTSTSTTTVPTTTEIEEEDEEDVAEGNEVSSRETDEEGNKSEAEGRTESEINKISEEIETPFENEIESEKVHEDNDENSSEGEDEREDLENSIDDTREEIEQATEIPEIIVHSTTQHTTSTSETYLVHPSTETEDESNEDEDLDNSEEETTYTPPVTRMHHQSSTVKSNLQNECDDGWRLDDSGNCVGEWN